MPLNTFDLQRMQDIQISDQNLQNEYIEKYQSNNITQAHDILNNTPQLEGKALTASNLSAYVDAVNKLEGFYFENVNDVLEALQNSFQSVINDIILLNEYNPNVSTEYSVGNFVPYNGETYFVIKNGTYTGTDIDNTEYFIKLNNLRGEQGETGLGVWYRGTYESTRTYNANDMVTYNNQLYVSKTTNTSKYPPDSPDDWYIALYVSPNGINVSSTEPPNIYPGMFWWQTYN